MSSPPKMPDPKLPDAPYAQAAARPFIALLAVMERLLAGGGCPWDREQTLASLKPYLIEEAYEVLEVMDGTSTDDSEAHCEELGDLLFQIVFQSALRSRSEHSPAKTFHIGDVCEAVSSKLIRRHPHVFADAKVKDSGEVVENWEKIKAKERAGKPKKKRTLDGVPAALPALLRAARVSEKARLVGFDWPDLAGVANKVREEFEELDAAEQATTDRRSQTQAELGDLLFSLVHYAHRLEVDPEEALRQAVDRFTDRFNHVEDRLAEQGKTPGQSTLDEMNVFWEEAKRRKLNR